MYKPFESYISIGLECGLDLRIIGVADYVLAVKQFDSIFFIF